MLSSTLNYIDMNEYWYFSISLISEFDDEDGEYSYISIDIIEYKEKI